MKYLTDEIKDKIRDLAKKYAPKEMCGIICSSDGTAFEYVDVPNSHEDPTGHFRIDAKVVDRLNDQHKVIHAIVHSHPKGSSDPSPYDLVQMNIHNRPYVIVGMDGDISVNDPERAPLIGRFYVHGTQDCYSIVRDYYARELGINLRDAPRKDNWWQDADHPSLYVEMFKEFGFVEVPKEDMRRNDVMLCRWGNTQHINHALIYLADDANLISEETEPCVGSRICLHHVYNGISGRFPLGEERLKSCELVVRHSSFIGEDK